MLERSSENEMMLPPVYLLSIRGIERVSGPKDLRVVNYRLTKKGNDAIPILTGFIQYGVQHHSRRVFEDGEPRELADLYPSDQPEMLGRLLSYSRGAKATPTSERPE